MLLRRVTLMYLVFYMLVAAGWQLVREGSVRWVDNFGVAFIMFILFILMGWLKTSKKEKADA